MTKTSQTADLYVDLPYRVVYSLDETTDGEPCVVAEHPELPGCIAHGPTREEALEALATARRDYIESLIEDGLPIPEPVEPTVTSGTDAGSVISARVSVGPPDRSQALVGTPQVAA